MSPAGWEPGEEMLMARPCMRAFLLGLLPMIAAACASGFEGVGDDDDDTPSIDARPNVDSSSTIDARIIDAPVSTMVDAPVSLPDGGIGLPDSGTGGTCTTHAQCGSGMCCFGGLMCIPGDPLPLPPPFDCIPQ
jgi:hypothetical protein